MSRKRSKAERKELKRSYRDLELKNARLKGMVTAFLIAIDQAEFLTTVDGRVLPVGTDEEDSEEGRLGFR